MKTDIQLIERLAVRAGMTSLLNHGAASLVFTEGVAGVSQEQLVRFAEHVALHCVAALGASRLQEQEGQPSTFPARILNVLHELADRKGTPTHGPAEDANGEPLQDDADAALAWITARHEGQPALSERLSGEGIGDLIFAMERWKSARTGDASTSALNALEALIVRLAATLAAGSQAVQVPGWRTIDSAPKNRTLLVGYHNVLGKWRTVKASFYPAGTLMTEDDLTDCDEEGYAPEGWYEETETHECILRLERDPELWQPLPAAPLQPLAGREVK